MHTSFERLRLRVNADVEQEKLKATLQLLPDVSRRVEVLFWDGRFNFRL